MEGNFPHVHVFMIVYVYNFPVIYFSQKALNNYIGVFIFVLIGVFDVFAILLYNCVGGQSSKITNMLQHIFLSTAKGGK